MDVTDWLKHITANCRVLGRPEEALRILPDVGVDGPALAELVLESGMIRGFLAPFSRSLLRPVGQTLEALLKPLVRGEPGENVGSLAPESLGADPLVRALAAILAEGAPLGPRSASAVVLECARISSGLLDLDLDELQKVASEQSARLRGLLGTLSGLEMKARGAALSAVAVSLLARISAAFLLASRLDSRVAPSRLFQAFVRNRMALVLPAGSIDPAADLPLAAVVLGTRGDGATISSVFVAVRTAISGGLERTDSVAAQGLRDLAKDRKDPQILALDPLIAEYVLSTLSSLTDARALEKSGLPKATVKAMLKGEGVAAMAASYGEVAEGVRVWDLLSTLAARSLPLWQDGGRWRTTQGSIDAPGPWALLGPRGDGGVVNATLVVMRAPGLNKAAAEAAKKPESRLALTALRRMWQSLEQEARTNRGVLDTESSPARAVFVDAEGAKAFMEVARRSFSLPIRLSLAPMGEDLQLGGDVEVKLHVDTGELLALWDTQRLHLAGPLVEEMFSGGGDSAANVQGKTAAGLEELFKSAAQRSAAASASSPASTPAAADPFSGGALPDPVAASGPARLAADPFSAPTNPPAASERPARPKSAADPFAQAPAAKKTPPEESSSRPSAPKSDPFASAPSLSKEPDPFAAAPAAKKASDADPFGMMAAAPPPPAASDDLFGSLLASEPAAADPFGAPAAKPSPEPESFGFLAGPVRAEPPLPPEPKASGFGLSDDPFASLSSGDSLHLSGSDAFASDPRITMTPEAVGWDEPSGGDVDEPTDPGGIVSMEIEDSEEEEMEPPSDSLNSAELFFLPPPASHPPESATPRVSDPGFLPDPFAASPAVSASPELDDLFGVRAEPKPAPPPKAPPPKASPPKAPPPKAKTAPERQASPADPARSVPKMGAQEVAYMFEGYVAIDQADGTMLIGRRYGQRIIDAHEYPGDADAAYRSFVQDKIKEGFTPRTDKSRPIPPDAAVHPMDMESIARALSEFA